MSNGGPRTRSDRQRCVVPRGRLERAWLGLCQRDMLMRMALAFAAAAAVCVIIQAWDPPMHWRIGMTPTRFISAGVDFKREDEEQTRRKRDAARDETKAVFVQDVKPLQQLRAELRNTIAEITKTERLTDKTAPMWKEFQPPLEKGAKPPTPQADLAAFQEFRKALAGKEDLDRLDRTIAEAFAPLEQRGLLAELTKELKGFNQKTIVAYTAEKPTRREIEVSDVTVDTKAIRQTLTDGLGSTAIADCVYAWLEPRLVHPSKPLTTFTKDVKASREEQEKNAAKVEPVTIDYRRSPVKAGNRLIKGSSICWNRNGRRIWRNGRFQNALASASPSSWSSSPCSPSAGSTCATAGRRRPDWTAWREYWASLSEPCSYPCALPSIPIGPSSPP